MKPRLAAHRILPFPALVLAGSIAAQSARAASQTWDGGSLVNGNWSTTTNWLGDPAAPGSTSLNNSADVATFNAAIANTWGNSALNPILIDLNRNIFGINFDLLAGNYFIGSTGGIALKLSSGGAIQILNTLTATNAIETVNAPLQIQGAGGTYTFANNSANGAGAGAGTLNFGGGITGGAAGATVLTLGGSNTNANTIRGLIANGSATSLGIAKSGAGTWTLSNTGNTFSGGVTLGAGVGTIIADAVGGTNQTGLGSGAVAIGAGSTVEIKTSASSNLIINNTFTGTGLLKVTATGDTGTPNNFLSGINGFSGTIELANTGGSIGKLSGATGTVNSGINAPNATLQINSGNQIYVGYYGSQSWKDIKVSGTGNSENRGAIRFEGGASLTVSGSVSLLGNTTFGTEGGTLNGKITSGAAGTQTLTLGTANSTGGGTLSGIIGGGTGTIALTKTQSGTVTLSNANTYTGATTISGGILSLTNALALQNSTLDTAGSVTGTSTAGLKTTVTTMTLGGLGGNKNLASVFTTTSGGYSSVTALTLNPGAGATPSYSGNIVNGAANMTLTKTGDGTQTLSGINSYTGATSVNAGTLVVGVSGVGSITSNVTVNSGATLSGSGTITGAVTVKSGGTHNAGNSPGIQTISGNTTYESGSIFAWDLNSNAIGTRGTNYDGVTVTGGDLTVESGAIFRVIQNAGVDFANAFWTTNQTWNNIFSVSGTLTGWATNTLVAVYDTANTLQNVSSYGSFTISGSTLNWSAVPEPSTALAGLLLAAGLLRRRRN